MREHVHHLDSHQRGESNRRAHVIGEGQKRGAERDDASMCGQAVQDRPHRMFANPKLQIAAGITPAAAGRPLQITNRHGGVLKVACIVQFRIRGWIQVGRAAD